MDKQNMEKILPALKNVAKSRKKTEPNLYLSDLLHVNPIADTSRKPKHITPNYIIKKTDIKFENAKQEQYYRLNRESKIKRNSEWAELLKEKSMESKHPSSPAHFTKNMYRKLQETNDDIDEATIQLEHISAFIQAKKQQISNNSSVLNASFPQIKENTKKNRASDLSNLKHYCTKNIYSEKSVMNHIENKLNKDKAQINMSHNQKNYLQKKKLNDTLGMVNAKLSKIKDKYLNNYHETNYSYNILQKKPKYKSVKDLIKFDSMRTPTMEASKIIQAELENDLNDLIGSNNKNSIPVNNHMEVLFENVDLIQKDSFQDDFSDEFRSDTASFLSKISARSPRQILLEDSNKYFNFSSRVKTPVTKKQDKKVSDITTIETQTDTKDNIQNSILKSDYLMHEFGLEGMNMSRDFFKSGSEVKSPAKKWNKDLEYFMS